MKNRHIWAAGVALAVLGAGLLAAPAALASYEQPEECVPSAAVEAWTETVVDEPEQIIEHPAVEEVSHTDYWYMPVHGEVGRWSHSDKGKFDTYDWTLYYRTGDTQKHVDIEAAEAWTETVPAVTHEVEHPAVAEVVCEPEPTPTPTPTEPPTVALPAQFSADPLPPTCAEPGSFSLGDATPNVALALSPEYDGPGSYLLTADALNGYEFPDGTTHKERTITVLGAIGYQSTNSEAPCFQAGEVEVTPTADYSPPSCTNGGTITLGTDPGYEWTAVANEDGTYTYTAVPNEGFVFPEGAQTQWTADLGPALDSEECDTPSPEPTEPTTPDELASTGGPDMRAFMLSGAATLMAGLSVLFWSLYRRSRA